MVASTCRAMADLPAAALLAFVLAAGSISGAASATSHKPHHPPASRDIEPDRTATLLAKPAARAPDAAKAEDGALPAPFHLPVASHARMRDCGLKWQTMKMSGEAADDIWRDFATRCLAAANGPFEKR